MKVRIAVFLDSIDYKEVDDSLKIILLFDVYKEIIRAAGRQLITIYNINFLIIWLIGKGVKEVYTDNMDDTVRINIEKAGILIHPLDKIKDNPLLKDLQLSGS